MTKLLIARIDAFTKAGKYVSRGEVINVDEVDYDASDAGSAFIEAPAGVSGNAVVEVSAIAPSGPNPQNPQQIPNGTVQTPGGYVQDGARLIGEVTVPEKQRIEVVGIDKDDETQAKVSEALDKAGNPDLNVSNEGTEGTVSDVSARVADMDVAALDQLEKAENDREKPRAGVLSAIEKRREGLSQLA